MAEGPRRSRPINPLGVYCLPRGRWDILLRAPFPLIKVELPTSREFLRRLKAASPHTLVMGRLDAGKHGQGDLSQPGRWADLTLKEAEASGGRDLVDVLTGANELSSPGNIGLTNRHDAEFGRRIRQAGYLAATSAWSVGNFPTQPQPLAAYREALEACDLLNLHAYRTVGQSDLWVVHRHEIAWPHLPARPRKGIVLGELGWDQPVPGGGHAGWRRWPDAARYPGWLEETGRRLESWARASGTRVWAAVFGLGPGFGWDSFDIDGEVAERLADRARRSPPGPWREDGEIPSPPPEPSPGGYRVVDFRPQVPDLGGGFPARGREAIERIVVHHTATCPHKPEARCRPWEELIQEAYRLHSQRLGQPGYPFHYTASPEPAWYYTGELLSARAACRQGNDSAIHVAIVGNYQSHRPNPALLAMLAERFRLLRAWLKRPLPLVAHEELEPGCGCPGARWEEWRAALDAA